MSQVVAIIQARMGSSRLPGKSLKAIDEHSVIDKVILRLKQSQKLDAIVLACPQSDGNQVLQTLESKHNIFVYAGSEDDVLDRYYQAALYSNASTIVRITGDCPLIDPSIVDELLKDFQENPCDYLSNNALRSYPRGFDCEVFSFKVLERVWQNATEDYQREHVTPYIYQNRNIFTVRDVQAPKHLKRPDYRICVDTIEDFEVVKAIYEHFQGRLDISPSELVQFLDEREDIRKLNAHIEQKKLNMV